MLVGSDQNGGGAMTFEIHSPASRKVLQCSAIFPATEANGGLPNEHLSFPDDEDEPIPEPNEDCVVQKLQNDPDVHPERTPTSTRSNGMTQLRQPQTKHMGPLAFKTHVKDLQLTSNKW